MKSNKDEHKHRYWAAGIAQRLVIFFAKPFLVFFLHFQVAGEENLEGLSNGIIFASNHRSEFDGEFISGSFFLFSKRLPMYYVARPRDFYKYGLFQTMFYTKPILHIFGAYPAIFGIRNYEKSLGLHIYLLKNKKNIVIFPEGTRSKDGKILKAKGGVVALAKYSGAPIVPVAITGNLHITLKDFLLRKRNVIIHYGKPIFNEELFFEGGKSGYHTFSDIADKKIMPKIAELIEINNVLII